MADLIDILGVTGATIESRQALNELLTNIRPEEWLFDPMDSVYQTTDDRLLHIINMTPRSRKPKKN